MMRKILKLCICSLCAALVFQACVQTEQEKQAQENSELLRQINLISFLSKISSGSPTYISGCSVGSPPVALMGTMPLITGTPLSGGVDVIDANCYFVWTSGSSLNSTFTLDSHSGTVTLAVGVENDLTTYSDTPASCTNWDSCSAGNTSLDVITVSNSASGVQRIIMVSSSGVASLNGAVRYTLSVSQP